MSYLPSAETVRGSAGGSHLWRQRAADESVGAGVGKGEEEDEEDEEDEKQEQQEQQQEQQQQQQQQQEQQEKQQQQQQQDEGENGGRGRGRACRSPLDVICSVPPGRRSSAAAPRMVVLSSQRFLSGGGTAAIRPAARTSAVVSTVGSAAKASPDFWTPQSGNLMTARKGSVLATKTVKHTRQRQCLSVSHEDDLLEPSHRRGCDVAVPP